MGKKGKNKGSERKVKIKEVTNLKIDAKTERDIISNKLRSRKR